MSCTQWRAVFVFHFQSSFRSGCFVVSFGAECVFAAWSHSPIRLHCHEDSIPDRSDLVVVVACIWPDGLGSGAVDAVGEAHAFRLFQVEHVRHL